MKITKVYDIKINILKFIKGEKMKKIINVIGIVCLIIVSMINIFFRAELDSSEHINILNNSIIYIIINVLLGIAIYSITNIIDKKYLNKKLENKKKNKILIIAISIYAIANIIWVIVVRPPIVGDQIHACNLAQTFYNNNLEEFLPNMTYAGIPLSQYMEAYHQQISLAFVFSLFFRIIHFDGIAILRVLNVIGNVAIVVALYKIVKHLSKKYEVNKTRLFVFILTFVPLIMLSTFIYGDIPSLALCLFATYFMMKYTESRQIKFPIYAAIFTMFAYMMRMNNLIFIIATIIYLLLNTFKLIVEKMWKKTLINIVIIAMYVCSSIIPATLVQNYYLNKYNMNKDAGYPVISYFLMAMEESWRGNGWYSENRGEYALKNTEKAKEEYKDEIKNRLEYLSNNAGYTIDFYVKKIASMWAENTYSSVRSNIVKENDPIEQFYGVIMFFQKAMLIMLCVCSCIVLIQKRKNLSLDIIFLITIFIGGFAFHILWEAKSRYIIPYIIVLMPIASLCKTSVIEDKIKEFVANCRANMLKKLRK